MQKLNMRVVYIAPTREPDYVDSRGISEVWFEKDCCIFYLWGKMYLLEIQDNDMLIYAVDELGRAYLDSKHSTVGATGIMKTILDQYVDHLILG